MNKSNKLYSIDGLFHCIEKVSRLLDNTHIRYNYQGEILSKLIYSYCYESGSKLLIYKNDQDFIDRNGLSAYSGDIKYNYNILMGYIIDESYYYELLNCKSRRISYIRKGVELTHHFIKLIISQYRHSESPPVRNGWTVMKRGRFKSMMEEIEYHMDKNRNYVRR